MTEKVIPHRKRSAAEKKASPNIFTQVRRKDYVKVQMPCFHPDPEIIFPSLFLRIYLTKMERKRKFGNPILFVLAFILPITR